MKKLLSLITFFLIVCLVTAQTHPQNKIEFTDILSKVIYNEDYSLEFTYSLIKFDSIEVELLIPIFLEADKLIRNRVDVRVQSERTDIGRIGNITITYHYRNFSNFLYFADNDDPNIRASLYINENERFSDYLLKYRILYYNEIEKFIDEKQNRGFFRRLFNKLR